MIISGPSRLIGGAAGQVCHSVAELRDIMPTLLDLAGQPPIEGLDGQSLMPLVQDPSIQLRTYLHGEHTLGIHSNHFIVTETDKYIWYSQTGEEQYFDLSQDPHELSNLIGEPHFQERITFLRTALIQRLSDREEGYSNGQQLITGRPPQTLLKSVLSH